MRLWETLKSWFVSSATRSAFVGQGSTDTEFSAEVVVIGEIKPHPNADRLEIATFEMKGSGPSSYEVVVGKGEFQPGSLACYFSVDCILPTNHPSFEFLKTRADGAGKTHFRLKAARLRGVFSQGLLVSAPSNAEFGQQVAEQYGVTYHRTEMEDPRGPTAPSARPKAQPFPVYSVESLKKAPHLFELGDQVHITEKIHGTNFRFGWVRRKVLGIPFGWKFVVGSHRVIKDGTRGGFYKEDVWTDAAEHMKLGEAVRDYRGYTFYGELYGHTYSGKPIQDLTYGRKPEEGPGLRIFDIRTPSGRYMPPFQRLAAVADCGLRAVPVLYAGPYVPGMAAKYAEGESNVCKTQIREGCVVENSDDWGASRRKAKFVGQGYLMRKGA